jgi:Mlc titration factor MtfA (ptsG expression regulator)
MKERSKIIIPLILFAVTIGFAFENKLESAGLSLLTLFGFIFYFAVLKKEALEDTGEDTGSEQFAAESSADVNNPLLIYYGENLNFPDAEIEAVLQKHFPYYKALSLLQKQKFIERTQLFIGDKIFKIHCNPGYKEMPILISAAAVQLTFGLKKYLLPNFTFIHVYPQEFLGVHPTLRVLEGNVSGHAINLSWKHFLEGYKDIADGRNTGLHELAHALYYQTFVVEENVDRNFRDSFDLFSEYGNKVYAQENLPGNNLYSDYALKNFQEFWAESMEIFFEKPWQLKNAYPSLYAALVELLNQDPSINTPKPGSC